MRRHRFVTNVQTVTRETFTKCAGLHCNTFTSGIANGDYDFDAIQSEFVKCVSGKCLNAARSDALTVH